ncbi:ribonuclease R [Sporomusa acidovorans]|uniref:Ribonuclease R n=1 Tax=Sporomusa acidovorans (strain ATCC 49682 / DSM 3132 / Mol) TaxID=1123286 RepID=A0ABZ3J6F8_SPOA4|nr:ribonuclease R [Sporomusa acidovorans]OZC19478.1 ribonuclease R [Sporomusa acidovorans DSM 3132]SDF80712.1 ribonuclease R [Sporomusa acidovorans]
MDLPDRILNFMREEAYKPLTAEDLAADMGLRGKELEDFWQVLDKLEEEAAVIRTRYGKYGIPDRMNLVVGKFSATAKGFGFILPEDQQLEDVFIPPDAIGGAMHGDRVVARMHKRHISGKAVEGEIIRIVTRANSKVVGTFEASRNFGFVLPDDRRIGRDIFIPKDEFNGAKTGAKVVVEIVEWPRKQKSAEGRILEVLGQQGDPGIEILSIIKNHNLPTEFPSEVEQAAARVPTAISPEELLNRRDLRELNVVTIDGDDAKDLDDAVYVERLKNGRHLLSVHIADVSHYVRENTPLDNEARTRGTSVYLVDRVIPMLPPRLSNGICSLNAGEDRLALSAQMEIDGRGQILNYEIFPSVIRVKKRLTYTIVRKIVADHDLELREKYADLVGPLEEMERLCRILRDRRMRRGAIDFDFPEIKVKLDDAGRPVAIEKRIRSIAESIIEEFMLVANETVAEHMHWLDIPSMFRVHEEPDEEKMARLNVLLGNFGQHLPKTHEIQPMALQRVLSKIAGRPEERIISTVMLRSLKQARYDSENLGHFGLAATYYTHFTSPIRRYPDLIVHRLIRETFSTGDISAKRRQKLSVMLPEIALHSSERERAAAEAERATVDLKKVEYMAQFVGEEFDGIISGVTAFGFFVEITNGIEGLVHISSLDDDYYHYVEEQYALIGERTSNIYRLGNTVKVIVAKVNPADRTIDYVLSTDYKPLRAVDGRSSDKKRGKSGTKRSTSKMPTVKPKKKSTTSTKPKKPRVPKK